MPISEFTTYGVTALVGVSAGLAFGAADATAHRWLGYASGVLTTIAVVVVAFALGSPAPWIGPVFALVTVPITLLTAAGVLRSHPGLLTEPYWRRVILLAFHRSRVDSVTGEQSEHSAGAG
ncbi:hypothetical protein [Microbacterium sp. E-13]|uniref:hypothetical protein n=1 Tax=Microbacterium sp. E-13 TaxID=3404048 RepID=UPI003CF4B985